VASNHLAVTCAKCPDCPNRNANKAYSDFGGKADILNPTPRRLTPQQFSPKDFLPRRKYDPFSGVLFDGLPKNRRVHAGP
jgi:hypothetical protein